MRWSLRSRGRHAHGRYAPLPLTAEAAGLPAFTPVARSLARPAPPQPRPLLAPVPAPVEPSVQLGFRDGTLLPLPPGSPQAHAMQVLASTLLGR